MPESATPVPVVEWAGYEAVLFDLDGVLTATARLHAAAWTRLFDDYLARRSAARGEAFRRFEPRDYARLVDGRPRYDGVRAFLASRGITVPDGAPGDPPGRETVCGLGNRKQAFFQEVLASEGVDIIAGTVAVVRHVRRHGVRRAVVSSSRNCAAILEAAGIAGLFELQVDGVVAERLGLAGKPAPDTFLHAARALGVAPSRAVVVEDAIAGVAAGRAGGFALVVGIDRGGAPDDLARAGADLVVTDLADTLPASARPGGAKTARAKPGGATPGRTTSAGAKPGGTTPGGTKTAGTRPGATKTGRATPGGATPGEAKPGGPRPGGTKSGGAKPGGATPGAAAASQEAG